jgi:hypothetical protein
MLSRTVRSQPATHEILYAIGFRLKREIMERIRRGKAPGPGSSQKKENWVC